MTTDAQAAAHRAHLERLCADGGPLTTHSRHATTPKSGMVQRQAAAAAPGTTGRAQRDPRRLRRSASGRAAEPESNRPCRPPGAGKSTAQNALIAQTRTGPEHWLSINPDDFKDEPLVKALADGSYDSYLVPDEVRGLEAAGEKFYPRELAALVHNESSILAKKAIRDALDRGDNIIIDGTLSGEKNARAQLDAVQAAGYDVTAADVETTRAVSEARTLGRWERGYLEAGNGTATGRDAELGGRWVPQSFTASLFTTADAKESICAANAAAVAVDYGCVSEYLVYRVADTDASPKLETTKGRAKPDGPLVDSETLAAVRAASTTRAPQHRGRPYAGKDFER